jgi:hypothetical protein
MTARFDNQPPNPYPTNDNQWHVGYSIFCFFDPDGKYAEVAVQQMADASTDSPVEIDNIYIDATNKIALADPPVGCRNTGLPQTNACVSTSSAATQEGDHQIRYVYRNWGGRCSMWLRIMVHEPVPLWVWTDLTPWSPGSPFIVIVPEAAIPDSAQVFGKLNGANIFFTPSDPLSAIDAQSFKLLEPKKVVPGLGTIYRVKTV